MRAYGTLSLDYTRDNFLEKLPPRLHSGQFSGKKIGGSHEDQPSWHVSHRRDRSDRVDGDRDVRGSESLSGFVHRVHRAPAGQLSGGGVRPVARGCVDLQPHGWGDLRYGAFSAP